jgi:hypothetical protein
MFKTNASSQLTLLLLLTFIVAVNVPSIAAGADNNDPLPTILRVRFGGHWWHHINTRV